ncbi:hypothetical protein COLO4_20825 [Corchorus olitorius]|uniref:Uncharacterized protein n=1 Tax=Corchorus olitorius TaxID=93759 RepID=A0A1R3IWS8_9ROSI|nr:hypothetical protein COLO4_20825 [Corchorus olitorius]
MGSIEGDEFVLGKRIRIRWMSWLHSRCDEGKQHEHRDNTCRS